LLSCRVASEDKSKRGRSLREIEDLWLLVSAGQIVEAKGAFQPLLLLPSNLHSSNNQPTLSPPSPFCFFLHLARFKEILGAKIHIDHQWQKFNADDFVPLENLYTHSTHVVQAVCSLDLARTQTSHTYIGK